VVPVQESYTQEQLGAIVGRARTTVSDILGINRLPQKIRDECRGDHQISRNLLIEFSRRKQERGMLASYDAYRASLDKGKTTRHAKDPNDPTVVLPLVEKLTAKLDALDTAAWSEEDQAAAADARLNPAAANLA
jgi:ParB family chromosome partitioning protein